MNDPIASILRFGDPRLKEVCEPVSRQSIETELAAEAEQLLRTVHAFRARYGWGRAIAAPQVGIMKRMIAMVLDGREHVLINPTMTWASEARAEVWDDCMSLPEIAVRVQRHYSVTVRFRRLDGREEAFEKADFSLSELLQHELDHLDGILMTDRMRPTSSIVAHENRELADMAKVRSKDPNGLEMFKAGASRPKVERAML
ncbi:peptide deformylase [Stappia sp. GBMRC 2046]|uniref:Peptide deformylase n=1 Tax=Stappia sediminis TaxID=2692190 RepID=A0A7X3LS45_9HYPH|nr:peptide deformylase [Stappia sediminis]MXN64102.1 peptide deformylase [Stappia sediminis]